MAESLVERLAAVLDQHVVVDVVEAWKQPVVAHWSCACGEKGEPRHYDSGSALSLLAEMRTHVAEKLTDILEVDHYRWMTTHAGRIGHADFDESEPYTQGAGSDEALARLRLAWWRGHEPDVTTRLLRRPVFYGPWEEVA